MTLDAGIDLFLDEVRLRGLARNTLLAYSRDLTAFARFVSGGSAHGASMAGLFNAPWQATQPTL